MQRYLSFLIICLVALYCVLWLFSIPKKQVEWGVSFSHVHAEYLGLNWQEVYKDMFLRLGVKHVRVVALWNDIEKESGKFDFSSVDFMMDEAQKNNAKVVLAFGQKAPRWPECHVPQWAVSLSEEEYRKAVLNYASSVVDRYKDHKALEMWQVENEPFIDFVFGECSKFDVNLVKNEMDMVHGMDPGHLVMVTDSGELSLWKKSSKYADILGTTLYRVVQMNSGLIYTYDWLPPSVYKLRAYALGRSGEDWYIAEAQAEPWIAQGDIRDTKKEEQFRTFTVSRFLRTANYIQHTGTSRAYWWGVEWWYYASNILGESGYLEAAQMVFLNKKYSIDKK